MKNYRAEKLLGGTYESPFPEKDLCGLLIKPKFNIFKCLELHYYHVDTEFDFTFLQPKFDHYFTFVREFPAIRYYSKLQKLKKYEDWQLFVFEVQSLSIGLVVSLEHDFHNAQLEVTFHESFLRI